MDAEPQDDLNTARNEVQRRIGQCLLQLQEYERLAKAIVVQHRICAPPTQFEKVRADVINAIQGKTLGVVVGALMSSFIVPGGNEGAGPKSDDAPSFAYLMQISLPEEAYRTAEADQRDLVKLRNDLVHHFLEQNDLSTVAGCLAAQVALANALHRITEAQRVLRSWTDDLRLMQESAVSALALPEVRDAIVEGHIPWRLTVIVQALRKAAAIHDKDGWALLTDAIAWVEMEYPDELPQHYGCSTWRQVVHETKVFDLRYETSDGKRHAWYRSRSVAVEKVPSSTQAM